MDTTTLINLIFLLCNSGSFEDRRECQAKYVNCAVKSDSSLLTKKEFVKKCVDLQPSKL